MLSLFPCCPVSRECHAKENPHSEKTKQVMILLNSTEKFMILNTSKGLSIAVTKKIRYFQLLNGLFNDKTCLKF